MAFGKIGAVQETFTLIGYANCSAAAAQRVSALQHAVNPQPQQPAGARGACLQVRPLRIQDDEAGAPERRNNKRKACGQIINFMVKPLN